MHEYNKGSFNAVQVEKFAFQLFNYRICKCMFMAGRNMLLGKRVCIGILSSVSTIVYKYLEIPLEMVKNAPRTQERETCNW